MTSQIASILDNFRQTMPQAGSGLAAGTKNYFAQQAQGIENEKTALESQKLKNEAVIDKLYGPVAANDTPEKWANSQALGTLPKSMKYEQREPFLMSVMKDKAFKTVEVGDETSPTGTRRVREMDAVGMPGKPSTPLVQVGGTQEKEEQKAYGKSLVSGYDTIKADANLAEDALLRYETARAIDIPKSGPIQAWKAGIGAFAEDVGIDPETLGLDNVDNDAAYQAVMMDLALAKFAAQKGPQTEGDATRIISTLASIKQPEDARKFLLDFGTSMERMKVQKRDFYTNFRSANGTFDGADKKWTEFRKKTPFLAKNPKTGRPVFFTDFVDKTMAVNPDAEHHEIVELWQKKYGRNSDN